MKLGLRKPRRLRHRYGHATVFWKDIPHSAKVVEVPSGWVAQFINYETGRYEDGHESPVAGADSPKAQKKLRERVKEDASK